MNYFIHYERLIDRARWRDVPVVYTEQHHIIPRCMGGSNLSENLVRLTPEEHYVAHQLLVKMYPSVLGLVNAAICMAANPYGKRGNKIYGWLRKRYSVTVSQQMANRAKTPEHKAALSKALVGKNVSLEARANMSKAKVGKTQSLEVVSKRATKLKGIPRSDVCKQKLSEANLNKKHTNETKKKISDAQRGLKKGPRSDKACESISAAMKLVWAKRKLQKQKGVLTLRG
jgi:hypothetical protein